MLFGIEYIYKKLHINIMVGYKNLQPFFSTTKRGLLQIGYFAYLFKLFKRFVCRVFISLIVVWLSLWGSAFIESVVSTKRKTWLKIACRDNFKSNNIAKQFYLSTCHNFRDKQRRVTQKFDTHQVQNEVLNIILIDQRIWVIPRKNNLFF